MVFINSFLTGYVKRFMIAEFSVCPFINVISLPTRSARSSRATTMNFFV